MVTVIVSVDPTLQHLSTNTHDMSFLVAHAKHFKCKEA